MEGRREGAKREKGLPIEASCRHQTKKKNDMARGREGGREGRPTSSM